MKKAKFKKIYSKWNLLLVVNSLFLVSIANSAIGNLTYKADEVGKEISRIKNRHGHGSVTVHKDKVAVIYSRDSGAGDGGFAFYDLDDPRNPKLVVDHYNDDTKSIREPHGWSMRNDDIACLQADEGIHFWDWSDIQNPKRLSYLKLPGAKRSDYDAGVWWTAWQGDYVYAGGSGNGLFIAEVRDSAKPRFVKNIPRNKTGGFRIGPVHAVGNLLFASSMDQSGYSTFDISDPENPQLLATTTKAATIYASLFNGNRIYGAVVGKGGVEVFDVSDPTEIKLVGKTKEVGDKGGYISISDGFVLGGFSKMGFAKFDMSKKDWPIVSQGKAGGDEDFATPIGNLLFAGNDHSGGSAFLVHQAEPDKIGPKVNFISPSSGAKQVSTKSRIGVTLTDFARIATVNSSTFIVRKHGGKALAGMYTTQQGIVNFAPNEELEKDQTYDVVFVKGGIQDHVGNGMPEEFVSSFTTGNQISTAFNLNVTDLKDRSMTKLHYSNGILFLNNSKRNTSDLSNERLLDLQGRQVLESNKRIMLK